MTSLPEDDIVTPEAPKKRRYGNTLGLTKETNPKLSNRLPREKGAIVAYSGDGLSTFERARKLLGTRVEDKRQFYTLDKRPSNTQAILDAGLDKAREVLRERTLKTPKGYVLDEKPSEPDNIMSAALDFLWAVKILVPRVQFTKDAWELDNKVTHQKAIVMAARKVVDELRKAAKASKAENDDE